MASNTDKADVNEILLGYYLNGGKWRGFGGGAKEQLNDKKDVLTDDEYLDQDGKARVMAEETLKWAKKNGYKGKIVKVWWTARPGVLAEAVGRDVDSRKNPTDILVQFSDKKFLGISAKSTKGKGDIGFKNPGIGTIEKSLNVRLKQIADKETDKAVKKFKLPSSSSARKREIRNNPAVQKQTQIMGSKVLQKIRDDLLKKLKTLNDKQLTEHVMKNWMDSSEGLYPPYIKVTGMGKKEPYTAKVENPLKSEKVVELNKNKVKLEKVGNESIGVKAGTKKIMKMRVKYESEKLASSIKFSGDPW